MLTNSGKGRKEESAIVKKYNLDSSNASSPVDEFKAFINRGGDYFLGYQENLSMTGVGHCAAFYQRALKRGFFCAPPFM